MKLRPLKIAGIALITLGAVAASAVGGTYTATYLGGTGVWEQDGNWSTIAYPNNGHFVIVAGNRYPDDNPLYDAVINIPAPARLGTFVLVQSLNVASGSTLNLLSASSSQELAAIAGFTDNGLITLNAPFNNALSSQLLLPNGSSIAGTGQVLMSDSGVNYFSSVNDGDTLTIGPNASIRGAGQLNYGSFGGTVHFLNFVNQGVIEANQPVNALQIGLINTANSNLTNTGTLLASGSGTLRLRAFGPATVFNTGGTLKATGNGIVRIAAGITVEGGTLATTGNGTIRGDFPGNSGGTLSNVTNTGTVAIANNEALTLAGTFTNNGSVTLDSTGSDATLRFANNTTLAGTGAVTLSNNGSNYLMGVNTGDALTIASSATIQGAGTISPGFSGGSNMLKITNGGLIQANIAGATLGIRVEDGNNTALTNTGTLRATNGATLSIYTFGTGTLTNNGGTIQASSASIVTGINALSFVQNSGTIDLAGGNMNFASGVTLNGGQLKGTGTFTGPVTVNANAVLQGGNGMTGTTLTVAGPLSLNNNSIIELTLGPSATHSTLARSGSSAWTFNSNQTFSFLDAGAQPGTYENLITGLSADPGTTGMWTITNPGWTGIFSYDAGSIDLNVSSVPEPSTWAMMFLASCTLLNARRFRSRFRR